MKVYYDLHSRNNHLFDDCFDRLTRCVMAHNGEYYHDIDKYGPMYARCWNEDEDGIELYHVYGIFLDDDGELVMTVDSCYGNGYHEKGERFTKYATDLLVDDIINLIAEMDDLKIGYSHHFAKEEMNAGTY